MRRRRPWPRALEVELILLALLAWIVAGSELRQGCSPLPLRAHPYAAGLPWIAGPGPRSAEGEGKCPSCLGCELLQHPDTAARIAGRFWGTIQ